MRNDTISFVEWSMGHRIIAKSCLHLVPQRGRYSVTTGSGKASQNLTIYSSMWVSHFEGQGGLERSNGWVRMWYKIFGGNYIWPDAAQWMAVLIEEMNVVQTQDRILWDLTQQRRQNFFVSDFREIWMCYL